MRSLGESGSTPAVVIGPDVESVHVGVDKRRFERVMANLLENAANYGGGATVISVMTVGPDGSLRHRRMVPGARERVTSWRRGTRRTTAGERRHKAGRAEQPQNGTHAAVEIAVEDAGPGISPVERTKVFDRFYRGSAAGRRGAGSGTGLGPGVGGRARAPHERRDLGRVLPHRRRPLRHQPPRSPRRRGTGVVARIRVRVIGAVADRGAGRRRLRHPDPERAERNPAEPGPVRPAGSAPPDNDDDDAGIGAGEDLSAQPKSASWWQCPGWCDSRRR